MKVLLTNDDGIDAPGIRALMDSVTFTLQNEFPDVRPEIRVVAPDRCRSECGHSIETREPLKVAQVSPLWHRVSGTPVDCIRVAIEAMGFRPDLVLSGINAGANLGVNLMVSGTFAAAREASLMGFPAVAISHYRRPGVAKTWDHAPIWLSPTLREFMTLAMQHVVDHRPGTPNLLWNVNLPAIEPSVEVPPLRQECPVDRSPIDRTGRIEEDGTVRFDLDFHGRPRQPGSDVDHCFAGRITVSKLDDHLPL